MIYLDNSATSFPKPPAVYEAVTHYMLNIGASAGRSSHKRAKNAMDIAFNCRNSIAKLINAPSPEEILFTKNATEGLNIIIKGIVSPGDKVTVSGMEHNAVMRPLASLNAIIDTLPTTALGTSDIEKLKNMPENTKLVIINHVSNVSGAINDVYRAGEICKQKNVPLLIDCSQSAGHFEIDVKKLNASVVFPGHKGIFAPPGTGIMYLHSIMPPPLIFGGTGSDSESIYQPLIFPDYYESGTLNMVGIAGLLAGVDFILSTGIEEIRQKEYSLTKTLRDGLKNMKNINVIPENLETFGSVISFSSPNMEPSEIAYLLDKRYDIAVRSGLHCAPFAHKTYGTFPGGTVRLSPGYFNTPHEMQLTLDAINDIVNH